ncbi:hypothetical protein [Streptomyces sp. NPDC058252]|uniref:hypothetical protein n=1 Tax=Streptomyces sp. NPDC058252 TaxID=3346405 RepID=UPI0036EABC6A
MSTEMLTALSALAVALVTAIGGVATAVVGRRQPRAQQRRDDFTAVTARLDKDIERLERRVDEQEADAEHDRARITAQDVTIRYLAGWVRNLVTHIRASNLEPPPAPPVPEQAQAYLHDVGL